MAHCKIESCDKPSRSRGWCKGHYRRWRVHGDPLSGGQRYSTPEESFLARTEPLPWSGCLIWTGTTASGYGTIKVDGKKVGAHRFAWEQEHGPIPDGMVIDHRYHCDPACCEPSHLRLATVPENVFNRRGASSNSSTGVRGVSPHKGGYRVTIGKGGRQHGFGTYPTIEEAEEVAQRERARLFGKFAGAS